VPWEQYRYAAYARRFGWTPAQVDELPLVTEPWLFPIVSAMDEADARRQEQAQADAERRHKRMSGVR